MVLRILFSLIFFSASFIVPFYFDLLTISLVKVGTGWVAATIILRALCILSVFISLLILKNTFSKTRKISLVIVFLIALPTGFGISFISPIYQSDYGDLTDDVQLVKSDELKAEIGNFLSNDNSSTLFCFFTTTCPHCKVAAEKIGINQEAGQKIKVVSVFPGEVADTEKFIAEHGGQQFDVRYVNNDQLFVETSGGVFPSVFLMDNNGNTLKHWTGDNLNYSGLDYLLNLEQ
ncbi:MAG: hypothetical protein IPM74_11860 [Crocinitomicaceae bacterium]|nr:hypothetical protein [Crocinitomicaceae bacterium]